MAERLRKLGIGGKKSPKRNTNIICNLNSNTSPSFVTIKSKRKISKENHSIEEKKTPVIISHLRLPSNNITQTNYNSNEHPATNKNSPNFQQSHTAKHGNGNNKNGNVSNTARIENIKRNATKIKRDRPNTARIEKIIPHAARIKYGDRPRSAASRIQKGAERVKCHQIDHGQSPNTKKSKAQLKSAHRRLRLLKRRNEVANEHARAIREEEMFYKFHKNQAPLEIIMRRKRLNKNNFHRPFSKYKTKWDEYKNLNKKRIERRNALIHGRIEVSINRLIGMVLTSMDHNFKPYI